ncbi:MAG: hypothetical protein QGI36_03115 [Candidatus Thalassarchaeaceae archaeon]|nr:hypothetical protein [Candidatus Thalassarchaeaceae archaeon]
MRGGIEMTEEKPPMPEMPPMPPMPPMDAPPAPPGMPPMDAPPAPPGMPPKDAPPPPATPPMDAPPAPPRPGMPPMPEMPPMDAPPAPPMPGMPPMPEMPPMDAPPMPEMPPMDAPPAPPGMPPMDAPPAPPMPEMPPMDAPPAPPGMEESAEEQDDSDLMSDLSAPPAPPMPEMPPMDAPPAPPMPPMDAPPAADALLAPLAPPADALLAPLPPATLEGDSEETEDMTPDEQIGEQAGATIRSRAEVDEVPGDKLEGSLHEVEKSTLSSDGEIIKQTVKGTLTINNPSSDDRIYDIDVILDNAESTDIGGDHVSVDELEAGKKYSMKYKVDGMRMLILREHLDTNPARSQERSLSVANGPEGGPLALEIEVENVSNVTIDDVEVTRPIPSEMSFENSGASVIEGGNLTWSVGSLSAGEKKTLSIEGKITVTGTKTINAGSASATYTANSTLSSLNFRELDAFCRGFTYMRVREDERPDNWVCKTIFENRSSFAVDLVKLQVTMKGSNELLFDVSDVDDDVLPNGKWESDERTVEATSEPDFTYDLSYTILPRAVRSTEGSISLEESSFDILEADVEKKYSTTGLRSYRSQKVGASLKLTNSGSSTINLMRITDDVPGLFEAPDLETMRISIGGKELEAEQFKAEVSSGITLEKEHRSPDGDGHTLTLTIGTRGPLGLTSGDDISIEYDLIAPDPSPDNKKVVAPLRTEFSAERFGPVCSRDCSNPPSLKVIHHRRDFSAGKQAIPLGGKGRYEVLILFENNGDTALQDVFINDVIPSNFDIKDWHIKGTGGKREDCEMTSEDGDDGSHVSWMIPIVGKNERLEVSFEIKGSGEVDAEALNRFHGVHFGDEVETEDVPSLEEESVEEEASEETAEEAPKVSWREDVLLRVMKASGIEDRDAFIAHAVNFDHDENGYLKKAELEDAAKAWNEMNSEEVAEEAEATEEAAEEAEATEEVAEEAEESSEQDTSDKSCPICTTNNAHDSAICSACEYVFE